MSLKTVTVSSILIFSICYVLIVANTCVINYNAKTYPILFDKKEWRDVTSGKRPAMAADLIKKDSLIGVNRKEIKSLLGEPDISSEEKDKLYYTIREHYSVENIDPTDADYLVVYLSQETVESLKICLYEREKLRSQHNK